MEQSCFDPRLFMIMAAITLSENPLASHTLTHREVTRSHQEFMRLSDWPLHIS